MKQSSPASRLMWLLAFVSLGLPVCRGADGELDLSVRQAEAGKRAYQLNGQSVSEKSLPKLLAAWNKQPLRISVTNAVPFSGVAEVVKLAEQAGIEDISLVPSTGAVADVDAEESDGVILLRKKLELIIVPHIEFAATPLEDAVAFLRTRSRELDVTETDPAWKGVNVLVMGGEKLKGSAVTLKLRNVPLGETLKYLAILAGGHLSLDENAVLIKEGEPRDLANGRMSDEERASMVALEEKLKGIVFPSIEFRDTPLDQALAFLQARSVELDARTADPNQKGVNIVLDTAGKAEDILVTLSLKNVPMADALRYTAELAGGKSRVESHAVVISK